MVMTWITDNNSLVRRRVCSIRAAIIFFTIFFSSYVQIALNSALTIFEVGSIFSVQTKPLSMCIQIQKLVRLNINTEKCICFKTGYLCRRMFLLLEWMWLSSSPTTKTTSRHWDTESRRSSCFRQIQVYILTLRNIHKWRHENRGISDFVT